MAVPPSALKDLVELPVAAEWKQLGLQLGVPLHRLRRIQANNSNCPDFAQECLTDMFDWWLNNGHDKTYERLARALNTIGKRGLARQFHESGEIRLATICFVIKWQDHVSTELLTWCVGLSIDTMVAITAGLQKVFGCYIRWL